jgi:dGTP triphosphohydrolase
MIWGGIAFLGFALQIAGHLRHRRARRPVNLTSMTARRAALCSLVALLPLVGCDQQSTAKAEAEQLRRQNVALSEQLDAAKSARATAEAYITELSSQVKDFADQVSRLTNDLQSGKEIATIAQAKFEEASRLLVEAQDEVTAVRASLAKTVSDANAAAQRYETEIDRLQQQIVDLTQKLADATRNLNPGRLRDLLPGENPPPAEPRR